MIKKYSLVLFGLKHPGEAPPLRSNSSPFCILFLAKKGTYYISYTFYWQMVPLFRTSLELCIPFNCCKCTLYIRIDIKPERVLSGLFTAITEMQYTKIRDVYLQAPRKCICESFQERMVLYFGLFCRPKWQNSLPFHTLKLVKSQSLHIPASQCSPPRGHI